MGTGLKEAGVGQRSGERGGRQAGASAGRQLSGPAGIRSTNGRTPGSVTRDSWRRPGTGARDQLLQLRGAGTGPGGWMWGSQVQGEQGGVHEVTMHG